MHRASPGPAGFALTLTLIVAVGLFSALVDGTLGWEYLARALVVRLAH